MRDDAGPADRADPADPAGQGDPSGQAGRGDPAVVPPVEALGLPPAGDVARAALGRARAAARARGAVPGRPVPRRSGRDGGAVSGPRVGDGRDPVLLGDTVARLAAERGWDEPLSIGGVIGRWSEVAGPDIAAHCTPETFEDGLLVVRADSTAWATHLQLYAPKLLARLEEEVGPGVVREVKVLGPAGPRWAKGKRSVPGRGPRDTYG